MAEFYIPISAGTAYYLVYAAYDLFLISFDVQRVWLEPSNETVLNGRYGFSVHGGDEPGSAGCIDLTDGMPGFAEWYKKNGKDAVIVVKYR